MKADQHDRPETQVKNCNTGISFSALQAVCSIDVMLRFLLCY
jgi:hypothetical protein